MLKLPFSNKHNTLPFKQTTNNRNALHNLLTFESINESFNFYFVRVKVVGIDVLTSR